MRYSITWRNDNPSTVYNKLAERLGRPPTLEEIKADLRRITREAKQEQQK